MSSEDREQGIKEGKTGGDAEKLARSVLNSVARARAVENVLESDDYDNDKSYQFLMDGKSSSLKSIDEDLRELIMRPVVYAKQLIELRLEDESEIEVRAFLLNLRFKSIY